MTSNSVMNLKVRPISKSIAQRVVEAKHYHKSIGIFWEGFGLYDGSQLVGVACYGQPSPAIQSHAFKDRDFRLYELTRLVVDRGIKNAASFLIGQSLKLLSQKPCAVISYADEAHGHVGIVYQATNWLYTGSVVAHEPLYLIEGKKVHAMSLRDSGITSKIAWAKENGIEIIKPSPKHRYFYVVGNKKQKKEMISKLNYDIVEEYPKGDKVMYDDGHFKCSDLVPDNPEILSLFLFNN